MAKVIVDTRQPNGTRVTIRKGVRGNKRTRSFFIPDAVAGSREGKENFSQVLRGEIEGDVAFQAG